MIYEAVIRHHAEFGKVTFRRFYSDFARAQEQGQRELEQRQSEDPEYSRSIELHIYEHEVF